MLVGRPAGPEATPETLNATLKKVWRLDHVGIRLRSLEGTDILQLESDRVFLDPATSRAALAPGQDGPASRGVGILSYLVNAISKGTGKDAPSTPYSFMSACSPTADPRLGLIPTDMTDDEIVIGRWLADHLSARAGDSLTVTYYELTPSGKFVERSRPFKVRRIVDMAALAVEKASIPEFPGLTDVDNCADWDVGMPMDEEQLDDKANEAYWKAHRQTPKAFVTLRAGQAMWANRFGDLSAVRYRAGPDVSEAIRASLRRAIDPAAIGLFFLPVREQALRAAGEALDFGQLFLGMSFFLIVAALMLTGLLFVFGVQQRAEEMGTLLALGYEARQVRRLALIEGGAIALAGSLAGAVLGTQYTRILIWGLGAYWQGAVAGAAVQYHAEPATAFIGIAAGFLASIAAMALAMWRQSRRSARELLSLDFTQGTEAGQEQFRGTAIVALACGLAAAAVIAWAAAADIDNPAPAFFGAGSLLLIAGMAASREWLGRMGQASARRLSIAGLGMRNAGRRRGRSLTATGLLACGCFLVFAVSTMQSDVTAHADKRHSGTGGFAFFGESALPVYDDLNTTQGRERYRLHKEPRLDDVDIVPLKLYDGDDASCFNLNRALAPRLLGVNPRTLARKKAFVAPNDDTDLWELLNTDLPGRAVPGLVGDSDTAAWGLKKTVGRDNGEVLAYRNERGDILEVKLVGKLPMRLSVFQGTVLISDAAFAEHFPSEAGHRMFLIDVPPDKAEAVRRLLTERLARIGLDITTTTQRLAAFYSVESTYLAMFLVLGGLGLLLGSVGLNVVVLRNVLERRRELALLRAVGFSRAQVRRLVVAEHWLLLVMGCACGVAASLAAMWPSLRGPEHAVPTLTIGWILAGVIVSGLAWIAIAAWISLRSPLIPALRNQ
jgi:ABC-type antimicrobial peptide transport system permease subunit